MKKMRRHCIDCGSEAVETSNEVKRNYRMETVRYACGAELKNSFSKESDTGSTVHSGCMQN